MLVCGNAIEYGKYSIEINKKYCQKHGYDFYVQNKCLDQTKHPAWSKILLMQNLLNENSDYIFYIDADACFVNHNMKIQSFINDKTITIANQNKNFNQPRGENSGVMLIKNNEISKSFFTDCWNIYEDCKNSCVWDQEAIGRMLDGKYKKHCKKLTCKQFNSYDGDFAKGCGHFHCLYEKGDYIIHMLRTSTEYKINKFKEILFTLNNQSNFG